MEYPKICATGDINDLNENINRFLKKYRWKIRKSRTSDPVHNEIKDQQSKLDMSTHQITLHITFWPWVSADERQQILEESTLKYASLNELMGIPEPDFDGEIDETKQYF